jgi:hypothetical protein
MMLEGDWTSIEESLPEEENYVWAYAPGTVPNDAILSYFDSDIVEARSDENGCIEVRGEDDYNPDVTIARFVEHINHWMTMNGYLFKGVTHWARVVPPTFE